jgi:chromosomal replication initiation ATPase DnaA
LVLRNLAARKHLPGTLFLFHGAPGVGKTFLLRSFRDAVGSDAFYLALPGLLKAFQAVHLERRADGLHTELCSPPVLVLDEVHRLAGKARLQAFVLELLRAREAAVLPTVLASRWHPKEIRELDPGLCSVLLSGFVAKVDAPGPLGRLRYLRALEGAPSRNGRAEAIEKLAQEVRGSYVDLRNALVRSHADRPAKYLELIDPARTFARVRDRVCERMGVDTAGLVGKGQGRQLSLARKVLAYLCVQESLSRAEVGRYLGQRTRAAVSYMTKSLVADMARKPEVRALVEGLL